MMGLEINSKLVDPEDSGPTAATENHGNNNVIIEDINHFFIREKITTRKKIQMKLSFTSDWARTFDQLLCLINQTDNQHINLDLPESASDENFLIYFKINHLICSPGSISDTSTVLGGDNDEYYKADTISNKMTTLGIATTMPNENAQLLDSITEEQDEE